MHFSEGEHNSVLHSTYSAGLKDSQHMLVRRHADVGMLCIPHQYRQTLTCMERLWLCSSVIGGVWSRGSTLGWKAESLRGLPGLSETSPSMMHSAVMYSVLTLLTAGSCSSLMALTVLWQLHSTDRWVISGIAPQLGSLPAHV